MKRIEQFTPEKNMAEKKALIVGSHPDDEVLLLPGFVECLC